MLLYDRRYVRRGQLYLRQFRRICTVIMTLRRVKCRPGRDGRGILSIMTKHVITTHKSHMSRDWSHVVAPARGAGPGAPGPAAGVGLAASLGWSLRRYVPGSSLRVWLNRWTAAESRAPTDRAGPANRKRTKGILCRQQGRAQASARRFETFEAPEPDGAGDLPLATLSSNTCVQSNIFEFVMT